MNTTARERSKSTAESAPARSRSQSAPTLDRAASVQGDPRWAAVSRRDADADGSFVYSVQTTGVYCRPSCGARRPRPEHVEFHASPSEAERRGYRPCKRCRPESASLAERHAILVSELCRLIEGSGRPPSLEDLAAHAKLSASRTHRIFRSVTGVTPKAYAEQHRAERVRDELSKAKSVTHGYCAAGYPSSGRFYAKAQEALGMKPAQYRAAGAGLEIRFAVGECSLGSVLVAATPRGVCAILLGDEPEALVHDLERRFAGAALLGGDEQFERIVARAVGWIEEPWRTSLLPLDIQGTAFRCRVWDALRSLEPGDTISYSELARRVGAPKAARAVASACAANPLAVAIPCHRVVRTDGSLAGYRWGIARKRELLKREAER